MVPRQCTLAGLGLGDRQPETPDQAIECVACVAVQQTAADHDHRALARRDRVGRPAERGRVGSCPGDVMDTRHEQRGRIVERLGLNVLRQGEGHGPGLSRRGEDAHRGWQRAHELLRSVDPVPVPGHGAQGVVYGYVLAVRSLQLLEHRRDAPAREQVAREQQDRQPVDGGERRTGHEIRGTRPDRSGARECTQAPMSLGECHSRVDHRLLVPCLVVAEPVACGLERLAQARDVAMTEDPEHSPEKRMLVAVALDGLDLQEANDGLGGRQALGQGHLSTPARKRLMRRTPPSARWRSLLNFHYRGSLVGAVARFQFL